MPRISSAAMVRELIAVTALTIGLAQPATAQVVISSAPSCAECRVRLTTVATLGSMTGVDALGPTVSRVAADPLGRYWVFSPGRMPLVFSSTGEFIREVGRRGRGPGEMMNPHALWALPGDSVGVFDVGGTVSVFDSTLQFRRSFKVPVLSMSAATVLEWPHRVIVNGQVGGGAGLPLHEVDASATPRITSSFGPDDVAQRPNPQMSPFHHISAATNAGYWTSAAVSYDITRWNFRNTRMYTLLRRPDWFSGPSDGLSGGPNKPPSPVLVGVAEDAEGRLCAVARVPSPTYKAAYDNSRIPNRGKAELRSDRIDSELLYNTAIEIIDPRAQQLVASRTVKGYALNVLPGCRLALQQTDDTGVLTVRILRLDILR